MQRLNLPEYSFNVRKSNEGKIEIFDRTRKKYVALTPEEWVRQNFIQFLINDKNTPNTLISVEKEIILNKTKRRPDIVIFSKNGIAKTIVECKAPDIKITQKETQVKQDAINVRVGNLEDKFDEHFNKK